MLNAEAIGDVCGQLAQPYERSSKVVAALNARHQTPEDGRNA